MWPTLISRVLQIRALILGRALVWSTQFLHRWVGNEIICFLYTYNFPGPCWKIKYLPPFPRNSNSSFLSITNMCVNLSFCLCNKLFFYVSKCNLNEPGMFSSKEKDNQHPKKKSLFNCNTIYTIIIIRGIIFLVTICGRKTLVFSL